MKNPFYSLSYFDFSLQVTKVTFFRSPHGLWYI
nr:MAG TPA: hypothetical protein [Caudoviricetes sp.]